MQFVKTIKKELNDICIYSKQIIVFSFWCSVILFAIALHRTAMEAAPSCFTAGFIAALVGDLAYRSYEKK